MNNIRCFDAKIIILNDCVLKFFELSHFFVLLVPDSSHKVIRLKAVDGVLCEKCEESVSSL